MRRMRGCRSRSGVRVTTLLRLWRTGAGAFWGSVVSGGRFKGKPDATALVGCRVADGHMFEVRVWEAGGNKESWPSWSPPLTEIEAEIASCFDRYSVVGFYADPAKDWRSYVNAWEARFGGKV